MSQPNRLAQESSLYLRQHANNPVDWFPWGPEAIQRAKELDRPIFLSIGYSACHWCHVMEHESFEDESIARILNDQFVSIKVDREERPDLDTIYMTALQAMTREGGGWPLSVWLTPDLHPFYAGTYFPPTNRYGRPGFANVLQAIAEAWKTRRSNITEQSAKVVQFLNENQQACGTSELGPDLLENARVALQRIFDSRNGGFGRAPKFPHPLELRLLLRIWKRSLGRQLSGTWWSESDSARVVRDLAAAVFYVCHRQPAPLLVWSRERGRIPPSESHPDNGPESEFLA